MSYHEGSNWQAKKEDEGKPLYGQEQFQKEVNKRLSPHPHQEGDKAPIDAGRLFDENADFEHYDLDVDENNLSYHMSREKFIEVLEQLRIPDAGMEKKYDDYQEFFEQYKEMITRYCIVIANVDIREDDGSYFFDSDLKKCVYVRAGDFNSDQVAEELENFEFEGIDKEGIWQIEILFKYFPGDSEEPSFMEILYQEATFCGTFQERDQHEKDMQDFTLPTF